MKRLLEEDFPKANDFASEVIPGAMSIGMKVQTIPLTINQLSVVRLFQISSP